jgi:UDP-glucose 4-epimerase
MKKVLVTGGAGFVGTNLCKFLKKRKITVLCIDDYSSGKKQNHQSGIKYIEGKTSDINLLIAKKEANTLDCVFHLGEYSKIATSFQDYQEVFNSNISGTSEVVRFCIENKIKIVYAGSSTKFAKEGVDHSPYSYSKNQNVNLIKACSEWFKLKYAICYFYNNYGPYQDTCGNGYETVISIFEKQKKQEKKLTIVRPGIQKRNYTYVKDTVEGIYKSALYYKNDEFQLACEKSYNLFDLARMFNSEYEIIDNRMGDRMEGACEKTVKLIKETKLKLDWATKYNLEEWINTSLKR